MSVAMPLFDSAYGRSAALQWLVRNGWSGSSRDLLRILGQRRFRSDPQVPLSRKVFWTKIFSESRSRRAQAHNRNLVSVGGGEIIGIAVCKWKLNTWNSGFTRLRATHSSNQRRELRLRLPVILWLLFGFGSVAVLAQRSDESALPEAPSPEVAQEVQTAQDQPAPRQQGMNPVRSGVDIFLTLQKKSLVFPDLATSEGALTSWDKLKLAANNTASLSSVTAVFIGSLYGQATNNPSGYGQGWGPYGQRLGADMARVASYNLFGTFAIASVTHEDPRFYVKKDLDVKQSLLYCASRLVLTRSDSGAEVVNYSGILGPLAAEGLANTYYPAGSRGFGNTMIRYSTDVGWRFAGHVLRQYWPEINRRLATSTEVKPKVAQP